MTPVITIALAIVHLATRVIELRLRQYEANPELAVADAENAEQLVAWGTRLLVAVERLVDFVDQEPEA